MTNPTHDLKALSDAPERIRFKLDPVGRLDLPDQSNMDDEDVWYVRADLARSRDIGPAMRPRDLEWSGQFAHTGLGGYYHIEETDTEYVLKFYETSGETGLAVSDEKGSLKPIAQRHFNALWRSMSDPGPTRESVIEECAKVADRFAGYFAPHPTDIAQSIRALAAPTEEDG